MCQVLCLEFFTPCWGPSLSAAPWCNTVLLCLVANACCWGYCYRLEGLWIEYNTEWTPCQRISVFLNLLLTLLPCPCCPDLWAFQLITLQFVLPRSSSLHLYFYSILNFIHALSAQPWPWLFSKPPFVFILLVRASRTPCPRAAPTSTQHEYFEQDSDLNSRGPLLLFHIDDGHHVPPPFWKWAEKFVRLCPIVLLDALASFPLLYNFPLMHLMYY